MRLRLVCIVFAASLAMHASTLVSTSCTNGSSTVSPCGGSYEFPVTSGPFTVGAAASDNSIIPGALAASNLPVFAGQTLSVGVEAAVVGTGAQAVSASADATAFNTYYSSGAVRMGLIEFDVTLGQLHGGDSGASFSDGTKTYSYDGLSASGSTPPTGSCFEGCQWYALVPFELGVPFRVSVSADDGESESAGSTSVAHGNDEGVITFTLFEANGKTPVAFSPVPEPSTWGLLVIGASGALFARRRAKRLCLNRA